MQNASPIITQPFYGKRVWDAQSALEAQTRFSFSAEGVAKNCAEELASLAADPASGNASVEKIIPSHFRLDACREFAASICAVLD